MSSLEQNDNCENEEDDNVLEESFIRWSNLLFLPFHPVFEFIVLISVIVKSILIGHGGQNVSWGHYYYGEYLDFQGPLQMVYPMVYCWDVLDRNIFLWLLKYFYMYACDLIYGIDTCLHIMHRYKKPFRQVTDKAMRREYLPKSALLLFVDIICLIPFFRLMIYDACTEIEFWPNILSALEFVTVYRVAEYFSLLTTHDYVKLSIGFTLIYIITVNCVSCFFILLTYIGLCGNCTNGIHFKDWRKFIMYKDDHGSVIYSTYIYGTSFIFSFPLNIAIEEIKASTLMEYVFFSLLMIFFYFIQTFIIIPKIVAESLLVLKNIFTFYPRAKIIIAETKRRNPSPQAYIDVNNFYALMWKQHDGVTRIPYIITELPRYLRVEIKQDLVWPVFYHSPTFRRTSKPYQKWLCDYIYLEYKLPGSRFFVGPQCQTHLYYIKSGIVQLISTDDGLTPLISVTSGTVFGDIGFFASPLRRKVMARCLTYCEVLYISRADILKSLHKFPDDRKLILQRVKDKINHARTLYMCKMHVRGLDRAENEGIAWIKKRWWEISESVSQWNIKESHKPGCELLADDAVYHCVKYIGQLVLCTEAQLHRNSLFTRFNFPLILLPNSSLFAVWQKLVLLTVFLVLIFYPPNITRTDVHIYFNFFQLWVDFVYTSDVCVSLITSMEIQDTSQDNFASIMFARFKSFKFCVDVISAMWFERMMTLIGLSKYYYTVQFNRLLKIYILFPSWSFGQDPLLHVFIKVCLIHVTFVYVFSYLTFALIQIIPELSVVNFFGEKFCKLADSQTKCNTKNIHVLEIFSSWLLEYLFANYQPQNLADIYATSIIIYIGFLIFLFCKGALVGIFHANNTGISNYQYFAIHITEHYKKLQIHPDLLKRLHRYLMCHWKYFRGMDVLYPNLLQDEPYDIYWKVHGEIAEKVISKSQAFLNADHTFIKEIAYHSKFTVLPKNSTVIVFGLRPKNVTWLVQGYINSEYHNKSAELVRSFCNPGETLGFSSVLFDKPTLRTYVAYTECEVLYLNRTIFFKILSRYPQEWSHFKFCLDEFKPRFDKLTQEHVKKYRDYQKKLRKQIFHSRASITKSPLARTENSARKNYISYDSALSLMPTSYFFQYWTGFRAFIVCVSIVTSALQGGAAAYWRWPLIVTAAFCDCITLADITIKFFMPYYDKRGLLITDCKACVKYYMTHYFLMDILGVFPTHKIYTTVTVKTMKEDDVLLTNTLSKFAHLYMVIGFFDYWADKPTSNVAYIMILKWQVISLLVMFAASQFFIKQCINFNWSTKGELINATLVDKCWLPSFTYVADNNIISHENISMIFAQSLNIAQSGLLRIDLGMYNIDENYIGTAAVLVLLGCSSWYVLCYCLTLLVLNARVNTLYQQGVLQLKRFLEAERVEKELIESVQEHFKYVWQRTKGVNVQKLISERIGAVFRQDLSYYFLKTTISSLNTLLQGGDQMERQLATACIQIYFLPGQEIIREMDLAPSVYIVHRGKVLIKRNGEKLTTLTKGAIFGQLDGVKPRPVRISAEAEGYADVLEIPIVEFQEALNDEVMEKFCELICECCRLDCLARLTKYNCMTISCRSQYYLHAIREIRANIEYNSQSKLDFMALKKMVIENPYNTVKYILRGKKTIKLPCMKNYMEATDGSWYSRWLFLAWLIEPMVASVVVFTLETVPAEYFNNLCFLLFVLDFVHLLYIISEFFTAELTVVDNKCVMRILKFRKLLDWRCYVDILTLVIPLISLKTNNWFYQLVRLVRLRLFYDFYCYFCTGFQSRMGPILLKFLSVVMVLHAMTCGWMMIACRDRKFPISIPDIPEHVNSTIDYNEWMHPNDRKGGGCARMTMPFKVGDEYHFSFVVPRTWCADYIVSMTYILVLYTHTEMDSVLTLNIKQVYYKFFINVVIHLLDIWILSIAISAVYTKLHELYKYDYRVVKLLTYLKHTGLSQTMLRTVENYTKHLWQRQRGNWLPELAHNAPQCLREDIFGSLYLYHLKTPPLLRDLPHYFIRQLVARLGRVVIFPGKVIVEEGDIYPCIYFIHEGEVEKWETDKSGETKMLGLLNTNDYFGFIPGLFPNCPYRYTYVSRTVVDIVFLRYKNWQDLLQGYPKVKYDLYTAAMQLKIEFWK